MLGGDSMDTPVERGQFHLAVSSLDGLYRQRKHWSRCQSVLVPKRSARKSRVLVISDSLGQHSEVSGVQ